MNSRNQSRILVNARILVNLVLTGILVFAGMSGQVVANSSKSAKPQINKETKRHATKPLREMAKVLPKINPSRKRKMQAGGKPVPGDGSDYVVPNQRFPFKIKKRNLKSIQKDGALQAKQPTRNIPDPIVSFNGMPNVMGAVPPDTNGDVGPDHYVQTVNTALAVWDKSGNQVLESVALNSLWVGLGGLCEATNRGDPIVLYDSMADRWLISQFAFNDSLTDNRQCIAISQTPDPTGAYYVYDFEFSSTLFNDYPKFGVWKDGYYMSANQFGDSFEGVAAVVYEREAMLSGSTAQQIKFDLGSSFPNLFTILPSDHDGILPAPEGSPAYFFAIQDDEFHGSPTDQVNIFEFFADWDIPANSTFRLAAELPVAAMDLNIDTAEIVQPNGVSLDSLSGFAMHRFAYRNLGDHGVLVVNHTVDADSAGQAGIRWYEINISNASGDISLAQEGTFAPADDADRWMGSAATDASGNIAVGYNVASKSLHPSVHYSGRLVTDPPGKLTQGEGILVVGSGSQGTVDRSRWADYSMLSVDPVDDCTFWYTTEYYEAANDDTLNWSTRIGSFRFPSCTTLATGTLSGVVTNEANGEPLVDVRVSAGSIATVTDTQGAFSLRLPVDNYEVSFDSYWYQTQTFSDISITEDNTTTQNAGLTLAPTTTVSGVIKDGSGQGWPLYSMLSVDIPNSQDLEVFTDPFTGEYTLELVAGIAVATTINSEIVGYSSLTSSITPTTNTNGPANLDFALETDVDACEAPGYEKFGISQRFEGEFPGNGWLSIDENDSGFSWGSTAAGRTNVTGGTGEAALMDSDAAGEVIIDTSFLSPEFVVADLTSTTLSYLANFQTFTGGDNFDLDIRVDSGEWQTVLAWTGNHGLFSGPGEAVEVELSTFLEGATIAQLRWHYHNANFEWFAMVDNIDLGSRCVPIAEGSLVAGMVTDLNTGSALVGATITSQAPVFSLVTSADTNIDDGLYFSFARLQDTTIEATATNYGVVSQAISPQAGTLIRQDIALPAAIIEIAPTPLVVEVTAGRIVDHTINVANVGTYAGTYELSELAASSKTSEISDNGRFDVGMKYSGPKAHIKTNASHIRDYRPPAVTNAVAGDVSETIDISRIGHGFGIGYDQNNEDVWIGSISAFSLGGDDQAHRFEPDGSATTDTIDTSSFINTTDGFASDMAYNSRTRMLWQGEIDDQNCIHEIDPVSKVVTGATICPEGIATGQHGLAYDPLSDTYFSGSWDDSLIHRFTPEGELLSSINTGLAIAGLAFNPTSGHLFVSVSAEAPDFDIVILEVPGFEVVGGFNLLFDLNEDGTAEDVMDDFAQGGLTIECDGSLWVVEQTKQLAFKVDTEEPEACEISDVPWLIVNATGELEASASEEQSITLNATNLEPGTFQAQLLGQNSSPYGSVTVPVTLNTLEPDFGALQFVVTNIEVTEENDATISLERINGTDFVVNIDYATFDGTAVAGTDYTGTSGTLTWLDGDSDTKSITVPVSTIDADKSFTVGLSNAQGGAILGEKTLITVKIKDKPKGSGSFGLVLLTILMFGGLLRSKIKN